MFSKGHTASFGLLVGSLVKRTHQPFEAQPLFQLICVYVLITEIIIYQWWKGVSVSIYRAIYCKLHPCVVYMTWQPYVRDKHRWMLKICWPKGLEHISNAAVTEVNLLYAGTSGNIHVGPALQIMQCCSKFAGRRLKPFIVMIMFICQNHWIALWLFLC